jgi:anthranilate phosphoribosyltransferase
MNKRWNKQLNDILNGQSMTEADAFDLMHSLAREEVSPALAGALLAGLRAKGETADEIRGFATAMRELSIDPELVSDRPMVDTVGTGGDGSGSLNLSTGTGLLAAACGLSVVKHGNRSVSSKSGSADVLEQLGMRLPMNSQAIANCLKATGFTFLFAPHHHPAMKAIMPVRNALGVRTVFNFLGPLSNPAAPPFHLIGAYSLPAAKLMAQTLSGMPLERAFVVHGEPGWDEATPAGNFMLYDVHEGSVTEITRSPADYGMDQCRPEELEGGDAKHNADELQRVLHGDDRGPHRDALVMGTSLLLEVCGEVATPKEGVARATVAIDDGRARIFLKKLREQFASQ